MMVNNSNGKPEGFFERTVHNPSALAALLIAIMGQAVVSIYFQVVNNEQQAAQILANAQAIKDTREQIFSMQTPLAYRVLKLEDRIDNNVIVFTMRAEEINRGMESIKDQQRRMIEALDNLYSQVSKIPPVLRNKSP